MNAEPDMFQSIGEVAATVVDRWAWWQAALADPNSIGKSLTIYLQPEQGYYRTRGKDGQWQPVAIWIDEDKQTWLAYRAGREVRDVETLWTYACRFPISYEAYQKALAGEPFEDEPPAPIGDNSGDTDPFEALRLEYLGEAELAAAFLKSEVKTQADADKAGIWAKRLGDISKRADGEREREKAPHLAASREVDDKWRPLVGDSKDMSVKLKRHVESFLIAQKRAEEARARAAAEEAAKLRREADAAADAARKAEAAKIAEGMSDAAAIAEHNAKAEAERAELVRRAREAEEAAQVRNATAGRTGARVALRTDKRAKIIDFDACLAALKDRPEVIEVVQQLANRAVKSGFPLAGVEVEIIEKVA